MCQNATTMIKDIKYNGYSTASSDYECPDGTLAASVNLLAEDNQLKPVFQPSTVMTLEDGCDVLYIHKTHDYTHYIILDSTTSLLHWTGSGTTAFIPSTDNEIGVFSDISHINAVGNTLIVFTRDAINYILWKEGAYHILGNHIPEIAISFGLVAHPRLWSQTTETGKTEKRGQFIIDLVNNIPLNEWTGITMEELLEKKFSDNNRTSVTEGVMAKVNRLIAEQCTDKGRFCFPFLVRWAYRLYDGTHTMQSAPILMMPTTGNMPVVIPYADNGCHSNGLLTHMKCDGMLNAADLDYCLLRHGGYDKLSDWGDIVTDIDIFISKPIYTYDPNERFTGFINSDNFKSTFVGKLFNGDANTGVEDNITATEVTTDRILAPIHDFDSFRGRYLEYSLEEIHKLYFSPQRTWPNNGHFMSIFDPSLGLISIHTEGYITLDFPVYTDEKLSELISSTCNFYRLASVPISDLTPDTRTKVKVPDDYLQSLVSRETLTDDYLSHDRLMADFSHGFNQRLNISGIRRELFPGFIQHAMYPLCQGTKSFIVNDETHAVQIPVYCGSQFSDCSLIVYIRDNGRTYAVEDYFRDTAHPIRFFTGSEPWSFAAWNFYPNPKAFKIVVRFERNYIYEIDLKPHDFLNGAYAFLGFRKVHDNQLVVTPNVTDSTNIVSVPNKIYTSEINNPFFFPLLGVNTVGDGTILGISSATKALSQGQFGQFPLYAFTTEGVWALEVSATGAYSAKQPVTRDVCINTKSITQLDSAVLFATDRGIMMLAGSQADCITDAINAEHPFNVLSLPHIDKLHTLIGHSADTCFPTAPFLTFLRNCAMIYDYVHQHIIVYNPAYTYAYIFSMRSKQWGMMQNNIASGVNSYPDALAMTKDNKLVSFSDTDEEISKGLFVTRPLKLETPDVLKTIDVLIQRGMFKRGDVQTVLYGSRDLYNWFIVWSSKDNFLRGFRGTPYKYYRIAGTATLTEDKSISGASIQYTPKHLNQPR